MALDYEFTSLNGESNSVFGMTSRESARNVYPPKKETGAAFYYSFVMLNFNTRSSNSLTLAIHNLFELYKTEYKDDILDKNNY